MSSFKALMQQAEKNQNEYDKHLRKINRQLEQDEKRKKVENERIRRKEESLNNFKKLAKSLPNDFQKNKEKRDISHSKALSKDESSMNKNLKERNPLFATKIKKIGESNNIDSKISKPKIEHKNKSNTLHSKKHLSFKDLMEKAKHNDISKPVINEVADFKEAKKALKNSSGRKKYKDEIDDDSERERRNSKKKVNKKESRPSPVVKKSKKELLNEQMEKRKREKERNLKAYDGSKDRVAQERLNILKSRGIYKPVTSKISQEVTEMVKRLENNRNNNQNQSSSIPSMEKSSSKINNSKIKNDSKYESRDSYNNNSKKHSRYEESDDYDSEYEYERRKRQTDNKKKVKKVRGMYEDYDVYDEEYVNNNVSSIIGNIFGYNRNRYRDEEDIDDMEAGYNDVKREEARSLRIAKREDEEEEKLERQRLERLSKRKRRD